MVIREIQKEKKSAFAQIFASEQSQIKKDEILKQFDHSLTNTQNKIFGLREQALAIRKKLVENRDNMDIISFLDVFLKLEETNNNSENIIITRKWFREYLDLVDLEFDHLSYTLAVLYENL